MKTRALTTYFVLTALLLSGCSSNTGAAPASASPGASASPPAQAGTVTDYYPIRENVRYVYEGKGSEFASFDVHIDYAAGTRVQQRIDSGGTVTVNVIEVADGKVKLIYSRGETYWRENLLDQPGDTEEVLLMEPIAQGTAWKLSNGSTRTITGVSVNVDTPAGSFSAVSVETEGQGGKTTDYYAKNVGLVKRVGAGEGYEVSSSLSEIQEDAVFQTEVRFYYPNPGDNKLYYKDKELSFKTNDITRKILETACKEIVSDQLGKTFSENTKINSLYLGKDGMVYLDLSKEFVTEMNAGTSYEAMVLQSVANTFGFYYGADKVVLTIDGGPYESGHVILKKGDYLTVKTEGTVEAM